MNYYHMAFSKETFTDAWRAILKDLPAYRLHFIKELKAPRGYRLFLLDNTDDSHISWIQKDWEIDRCNELKFYFEKSHLSYEIHLRESNTNIHKFLLSEYKPEADEALFVDNMEENTDVEEKLRIHIWNTDPVTEDVVGLLARKEFQQ